MSARKFKVGDRVRIVKSCVPGRIGCTTTILAFAGYDSRRAVYYYQIDVPSGVDPTDGKTVLPEIQETWLELIYDGNEKVSWSECAWQPKKVGA